jgi:hypothetical protein
MPDLEREGEGEAPESERERDRERERERESSERHISDSTFQPYIHTLPLTHTYALYIRAGMIYVYIYTHIYIYTYIYIYIYIYIIIFESQQHTQKTSRWLCYICIYISYKKVE